MRRASMLAVAALVMASAIFGAIGAVASELDLPPGQEVVLLLAAAAVPLAVAGPRLDRPDLPRVRWRAVVLLGVLNAFQVGAYLTALQIGPVGPVAALHLSVPVVYLVWELARRQRRADLASIAVLLLAAGGAAIAGLSEGGLASGPAPALALGLAVLSAIVLAVFLALVSTWSRSRRVRAAAGGVHIIGALVLLPAFALGAPSAGDLGLGLAMGALLWAPAVLLQWWAVSRLRPVVFGTLLLFEAVFAALIATIAFDEPLSPLVALAVALIVGAAWLEVRRQGSLGVPV